MLLLVNPLLRESFLLQKMQARPVLPSIDKNWQSILQAELELSKNSFVLPKFKRKNNYLSATMIEVQTQK
jgi:hypothetical protein